MTSALCQTAFKHELFELRKDWTQSTDVAAANPEMVKEMTDLMFGKDEVERREN